MEHASPAQPLVATPPQLPDIVGLSVRTLKYPAGLRLARHRHSGALLCYVIRGGYRELGPHGDLEATSGAMTYQPPGEPHCNRVSDRGLDGLRLEIDPSRMGNAACSRGPMRLIGRAAWYAQALNREVRRGEDAVAAAIESLVVLILTEVSRERALSEGGLPLWLPRVRERLDEALSTVPSLAELAQDAGVHPGHLARAFREHFGCTVGDYVRERRLARACALLKRDTLSLAEIAHRCGFSDQSHFGRAFKHRFGVSPGVFRRNR